MHDLWDAGKFYAAEELRRKLGISLHRESLMYADWLRAKSKRKKLRTDV